MSDAIPDAGSQASAAGRGSRRAESANRAETARQEPRPPLKAQPHVRVSRDLGDNAFGAMLLSPAFLFVACLAIYPIFRVIWLSVHTQNLGTELMPQFSGAGNYVRLWNDGHYFTAM